MAVCGRRGVVRAVVVEVVDAVGVGVAVAGLRLVSGAVELCGLVLVGDHGHARGV